MLRRLWQMQEIRLGLRSLRHRRLGKQPRHRRLAQREMLMATATRVADQLVLQVLPRQPWDVTFLMTAYNIDYFKHGILSQRLTAVEGQMIIV